MKTVRRWPRGLSRRSALPLFAHLNAAATGLGHEPWRTLAASVGVSYDWLRGGAWLVGTSDTLLACFFGIHGPPWRGDVGPEIEWSRSRTGGLVSLGVELPL